MNMFAKIMDMLRESRQRRADEVIQRYSYRVKGAQEYAREQEQEQDAAEAPASPAFVRKTLLA